MIPPNPALVLSCEHGGHRLPRSLAPLFAGAQRTLRSHRGYDRGALQLARLVAKLTAAPLLAHTTSRLVIDLNRSLGHPQLFGPLTQSLDGAARAALVTQVWAPHRRRVLAAVAAAAGMTHHLCLHSFTPRLGSKVRQVDVGLLYDPQRPRERALAGALQAAIKARLPTWRVRRNSPYRGTSDGLTTAMRRLFADSRYAGLEIEVNQKWVRRAAWARLCPALAAAVANACGHPCKKNL